MIQYIDVRYDPTCNLKCKTCGPQASTLWQKEKNIRIPINPANLDYFANVDKRNLKKVYLAGGEPTYIKSYLDFLEKLYEINPECEVIINTNLKKLPDSWKQIITKFRNLTIVCSCDAIGVLGTYVRYPLQWKEFEENVKFVKEHANFLQFNLVASNITSHKLFETCSWMGTYSKNINLSILENPACFSEKAVPHDIRNSYLENISKLEKFPISVYYALNFRRKIAYLLKKYSDSVYDESLHKELQSEIREQDSHRLLQLPEADPFLQGWIYR
jgi:organic radical activating enzyme